MRLCIFHVFLLISILIVRVSSLLKNCVTDEEWEKDTTHPRCEIISSYRWYCLAKDEISVQRPRTGPGESVKTEDSRLVCWAPYPIDVDVASVKMKGFTGVFYKRRTDANGTELLTSLSHEYTILIPLIYSLFTPRTFTIYKYGDRDIKTEFYVYSPGANDVVLPYDWPGTRKTGLIIPMETKQVVIPCVVTNPNDTVSLKKLGSPDVDFPIDNTTVRFIPREGFILDTDLADKPWGRYLCTAQNPRTRIDEELGVQVIYEEFVAEPPTSTLYAFANVQITLTCRSKRKVYLNGTLNGKVLDQSAFQYNETKSLILAHTASFVDNNLKPEDLVVVTCTNELELDLASRSPAGEHHVWNLRILDVVSNDILEFKNEGTQVTCSSRSNEVALFNVDCFNFAHCRTRNEFFGTLGVGQCDLRLEWIGCGTICEGSNADCFALQTSRIKPKGYLKCQTLTSSPFSYGLVYFNGYNQQIYTDFDQIPPEALVRVEAASMPVNGTFYVRTVNTFKCQASSFLSDGEYRWIARRPDGSLIDPIIEAVRSFTDYSKSKDSIWEADIRIEEVLTDILCLVPRWNSDSWVNLSLPLNVKGPTQPDIINNGEEVVFDTGEDERNFLVCKGEGDPMPKLEWRRNGKPVTAPFQTLNGSEGLVLTFPHVTHELQGVYECHATSVGGEASGYFTVTVIDPPNITLYIVLGLILLILLSAVLVILWWKLRKANKAIRNLTDEEVNLFINGNPEALKSAKDAHEMICHMPFNMDYEIPIDKLKFDKEHVLGSGAFGIVYRGKLEDYRSEVAIKTIKPFAETSYFKALLMEVKVMVYLGKHENIVGLIGAYTANIKERVVYMVVELSPYGSLENFLRLNQKRFQNLIQSDRLCMTRSMIDDLYANLNREYTNISDSSMSCVFSTSELVDWSCQIANGMTHLEEKKVIHADLATRNILLYENGIVKITDFGLSRQLYAYTNYVKKQQEPLPWRWMAVESLREMNFSTQSDIWGYGVTLWEIYSLGAVPYPGLAWSIDFVEKLVSGLRLKKPTFATMEIYEWMALCWHLEPSQRPTFQKLKAAFEGIKCRMSEASSENRKKQMEKGGSDRNYMN